MDVILKEDVENLGQKGEIVHVAPGYARNYLFPRTLAVAASEGNLKNLQHFIAAAEKKREGEREEARKLAEKIAELEIKIEARAGAKNRLFGSITSQHIANAVNAVMDLKLDKKKIAAGGGIKMLGKHKVMITVYPGVTIEKEIEIVASEGELTAEEKAEMKAAKKERKAAKASRKETKETDEKVEAEETKETSKEETDEVIEESQKTTGVSVEESAAGSAETPQETTEAPVE